MKNKRAFLVFTLGLVCAFSTRSSFAQDRQNDSSLQIPISVDGQAAVAKEGEPFAKINQPVSASAPIEVQSKASMIIFNVTAYDTAKQAVVPGAPTAIILFQGTPKGTLDKTMDNQKLKPGNYLMSVVADNQSDSILLQVK